MQLHRCEHPHTIYIHIDELRAGVMAAAVWRVIITVRLNCVNTHHNRVRFSYISTNGEEMEGGGGRTHFLLNPYKDGGRVITT